MRTVTVIVLQFLVAGYAHAYGLGTHRQIADKAVTASRLAAVDGPLADLGLAGVDAAQGCVNSEGTPRSVRGLIEDTVHTLLFGGGWPDAPHRVLRTPFVERWLPEERRGQEQRPDEATVGETRMGGERVPVARFTSLPPSADASGDIAAMAL